MNSLIRHIEYLMSRNDCVIIPGIGAVLARYQSARIDCDTLSIMPPTRVFAFNPMLKDSDGHLACSIAKAEGISYDAACSIVDSCAEAMLRQLHSQGEVAIGRLGILKFTDASASPEFCAFVSPMSSSATGGLPEISFQEMPTAQAASAPLAPIARPYSPIGRFTRVAASVALLIGICFVASTPISVDSAALASLSPSVQRMPAEELLPSGGPELPCAEEEASQPSELIIIGSAESIIEIDEPAQTQRAPKYLVIVGSFTSAAEAQKFISLNDPSWQIIEADGRIRVYSEGFDNQSEAYKAVRQNREKYSGAWVYTNRAV
ncbi:MAG: SPOR domain-containing protein [Clostridium sp.]|nr:SPOR domain-containing protein [Clostridium sp.]